MRARIALFVALLVLPAIHRPITAATAAAGSEAVRANALWEPPTGPRDLFNGPWGARLAPDPTAVYTFVRPKETGTNPGVIVRDPQGRIWHVKQGPKSGRGAEGPPEVMVSRVLSALGYHQPPVYFLPSFQMRDRTGVHTERGGRFRLDDPSLRDAGTWSWDDPRVKGSRPYNGLLVILLAFSSWDLKESNNKIYQVQQNGRVDNWYVVRDLGSALGDTGRIWAKKNNIEEFERKGYIAGLNGDFVKFDYGGKRRDLVNHRITVDDLRWAMALLTSLDQRQWHDAFRAGGYSPELSDRFIQKIQTNILQGQRALGQSRALVTEKR